VEGPETMGREDSAVASRLTTAHLSARDHEGRGDDLLGDVLRALREERAPFAVLGYAALALVVAEHLAVPSWLPGILPGRAAPLARFVWWVTELAVLWGVGPLMLARLLGIAPRALGLGLGELRRFLPAYGILYLIALAAVFVAATQTDFLHTYPLIERDPASWSWGLLAGYWLLYTAQFVCVELFFRGFLLFPLRPRFGDAAIAVMVVPYAMLHVDKPLAEALGAIAGGAALGWLALRAETIWGGVLVHATLALTMDVAALTVAGAWPARW
jgi:hypothetical protein